MRVLLLIPLLYFHLAVSKNGIVIKVIQHVNLGDCGGKPCDPKKSTDPPELPESTESPEPPFNCSGITALNSSEELRNISVSIDTPLGYVLDCLWEVEVPQDYAVHFIWSRFEMGGDCDLGSVNVNNSLQSDEYCDSELPEPFTLFSGSNEVRMSTSQDWNGGGFSLEYSHIYVTGSNASCSSFTVIVKEGTSGSIAVESSSSTDDDLYCEWLLETPDGEIIDISFETFQLEYDANCLTNSLEFFDFPSFESLNGKMCGNSVPSNIVTSSNRVLIRFSSNNTQNFGGFALNYITVDPTIEIPGSCSSLPGVFVNGSSGSLSIAEDNYVNDLDCEWLLDIPEHSIMGISFSRFHLEYNSICKYDHVQLFNTPPLDSLTEKMCGNDLPSSVLSQSNQVLIRFKTDLSFTFTGFELSYTVKAVIVPPLICDDLKVLNVHRDESNLTVWNESPDVNKLQCVWLLMAPLHHVVQITFNQIEIGNCSGLASVDVEDEFYNGDQFCASGALETYTSERNYVWLIFRTEWNWNGQGFSLQYTAIPE